MNLLETYRKVIAAARAIKPDDRVPLAFERRVMARLAGQRVLDFWDLWGRALSRAAVCCLALMLLMTLGSFLLPEGNSDSLTQDVEKTLFAAVDNNADQNGDSR
jgi:hypothetical protein